MARYAVSRVRSLTGLGRTFTFAPRRRGLRGLGDDSPMILPDFGPAPVITVPQPTAPSVSPIDTTMIEDTSGLVPPPSFFAPSRPIIPAQNITPVTAPDISAGIPGGGLQLPKIVFPSGGTVRPATTPPSVSWLDQQMIAGIPNSYLALGTVGAVLLFSVMGAKRRR